MTAWLLHDEFLAMRACFRRALGVSIGLHALLAAALLLVEGSRPQAPRIIEVTWLEPAAVPVVEPVSVPAPAVVPRTESLPEPEPEPAVVPEPVHGVAVQRSAAARAAAPPARARHEGPRHEEQLAALAATRHEVTAAAVVPAAAAVRERLAAAPVAGADVAKLAVATMAPVAERGRPVALARGPEGPGAALALNRGPVTTGAGVAAAAAFASGALAGGAHGRGGDGDGRGTASVARAAAAPKEAGGGIGDILLAGPAADRAVVAQVLPSYPEWARREAVEATVRLHFTVLPDGRVREDVRVERTGGAREFDEQAVAAFRQWRFAALPGADATGQWGTITFRFRLRG